MKVQRPRITEQIALDMHLLRSTAPFFKDIFNLNTDLIGVIDKWGNGFVAEINYKQEASNAERFMKSLL